MAKAPHIPKRMRTRDKLLRVTQELLLEKSASDVSIREITDRAGVVHATFYNYFKTTGEAFDAVTLLVLTAYARVIDRTVAGVSDPAEYVSASIRQTMRIVSTTTGIGRILFDAGLNITPLVEGLRALVEIDVRKGLDAGRFQVEDVDVVVSAVSGLGLAVAMDVHRGRVSGHASEGVAMLVLRMLGVPADDAVTIVANPPAFHEMPPLPLSWIEQTAIPVA